MVKAKENTSAILTVSEGAGLPISQPTERTPINASQHATAPAVEILDDGADGGEDAMKVIEREMGAEWLQGKHVYGARENDSPRQLEAAGYQLIKPNGADRIQQGDIVYWWIPQEIYQRRVDYKGNTHFRIRQENEDMLRRYDKMDADGNVLRIEDKLKTPRGQNG